MGTLKTYKSKGALSLNVRMSDGRGASVSFGTQLDGTGVFETTDPQLHSALASHPKYGKLFVLDVTESVDYDKTDPKVIYSVTDYEDIVEQATARCSELAEAIQDADDAISDINTAGANALEAIEEAIQGLDIAYEELT